MSTYTTQGRSQQGGSIALFTLCAFVHYVLSWDTASSTQVHTYILYTILVTNTTSTSSSSMCLQQTVCTSVCLSQSAQLQPKVRHAYRAGTQDGMPFMWHNIKPTEPIIQLYVLVRVTELTIPNAVGVGELVNWLSHLAIEILFMALWHTIHVVLLNSGKVQLLCIRS